MMKLKAGLTEVEMEVMLPSERQKGRVELSGAKTQQMAQRPAMA